MEFKIGREEIVRGLAGVQSIVERKNTIQILSNVLLKLKDGKLTVEATDLEVGLSATYPVEVISEGGVTVDAKMLYDIVRQIPEGAMIHFKKKENNWLEVMTGRSLFNIMGLSADEFPEIPGYAGEDQWTVSPDILMGMIDKTIFAVSHEDVRYNLSGVYLEVVDEGQKRQMRMVATDGHRLSLVDTDIDGEIPFPKGEGVILPRKGLNELRKLIDGDLEHIGMRFAENNLMVKFDDIHLVIRLIDGRFPNYLQVIPQANDKKVTVNREDFLKTLRRVSVLSQDTRVRMVKFHVTPNTLEVTTESPDVGTAREEITVKYSGPELNIGFNANYLIDILTAMDDDEVICNLLDESSPGEIRPTEERGYFFIIMPMKI